MKRCVRLLSQRILVPLAIVILALGIYFLGSRDLVGQATDVRPQALTPGPCLHGNFYLVDQDADDFFDSAELCNCAGGSCARVSCEGAACTKPRLLTLNKVGGGSGIVDSDPAGINCGADCSEAYLSGMPVTLTPRESAGSTFGAWAGCDTLSNKNCIVTMNRDRSVTVQFNLIMYRLTVAKSGVGSGTITSTGINCGTDCTETYAQGTSVVLAQSSSPGSAFVGWGATGCTGAACAVTMDGDKTVVATFGCVNEAYRCTENHGESCARPQFCQSGNWVAVP
jgi:hypothetical protein